MKQSFKKDYFKLRVKDYVSSHESFDLYLDSNRDIVWTHVKKGHNHIKYYNSQNYIPHVKNQGFFSLVYTLSQKLMFYYKSRILNKHLNSSSKILDYGSGDGHFANYLSKKGLNVETYDPITKSRKTTQVSEGQVDVIMFWHVLEHLPDLDITIQQLLKKLTKKGIIVIALPNRDSLDCKIYKEYWAAWDVPRHLYHFNHNSIRNFMISHRLSLISKHPLILDSFYISYLSSKNKKSFFPWITAILVGALSNLVAAFTSNHSSSVYIFKRS